MGVEFPQTNGACLPKPGRYGAVLGGEIARHHFRGGSGRHAGDMIDVLIGDGDPVQRSAITPSCNLDLSGARGVTRLVAGDIEIGAELVIERGNPLQIGVDDLNR
jgi:hypothetical protein